MTRCRASLFLLLFMLLAAFALDAQSSGIPVIDKAMRAEQRKVYQTGVAGGNRSAVFARVGDSITYSDQFLKDIGCSVEVLAGYSNLASTITYFRSTSFPASFTTAWCGVANSFSRDSLTSGNGWTTNDPLKRFSNPLSSCPAPDDNPLRCEIRTIKPSIALIMFGTNDLKYHTGEWFRNNLKRIVQELIILGVVPVLSTIPPRLDSYGTRVASFNQIIKSVAATIQVPVWDYWLILQNPQMINQGIDIDGIHPNSFNGGDSANFISEALRYGYNQRNLTALFVLKKLKAMIQGTASADPSATPNFSIFPNKFQVTGTRGTVLSQTVTIARNKHSGSITFSLESPPTGITGKFTLNSLKTAAKLRLLVGSGVTPGNYRITVHAKSGLLIRTSTFALQVR